jgi:hypothetical protein
MASSTCDRIQRPTWGGAQRVALALALVLVSALPAAAAPAPEAETGAKSAARAKLVEGMDLLKSGRYGEALKRFNEAYALVPSPLITYDFGLAYLGLGDRPRALEAFDTFLAEAHDAPADKRRKAEGYREELRGQVAVVELTADVDSAQLSVDGVDVGPVSFPRRVYLPSGSHELVARVAVGGAPRATTVVCGAGQTVSVAIRLSVPPPAPGTPTAATSGGVQLGALEPAAAEAARAPSLVQASGSAPPPAPASHARIWALSLTAAGVVAAGTGIVFGVLAKNDGDALTDDARNLRDFMPATEAAGLRNQRLETVFLSIGAAAIIAGVGLYAMIRHQEAARSTPRGP